MFASSVKSNDKLEDTKKVTRSVKDSVFVHYLKVLCFKSE